MPNRPSMHTVDTCVANAAGAAAGAAFQSTTSPAMPAENITSALEGIVGDAGAAVAAPAAVPTAAPEPSPAGVPAAAPEPGVKFERKYLNLQLALNRMHDELHEDNLQVDKLKQVLVYVTQRLGVLYDAHTDHVVSIPVAAPLEAGSDGAALLREAQQDKQLLVRLLNSQERRKRAVEHKMEELLDSMAKSRRKHARTKTDAKQHITLLRHLKGLNISSYDMAKLVDLLRQQTEAMRRVKYMILRRKAEQMVADSVDGVLCPIGRALMREPMLATDGHTYERAEIERWFAKSNKSPKTLMPLSSKELTSNYSMRSLIQELVDAKLQQLNTQLEQEVSSACAAVQEQARQEAQSGEGESQAKRRRSSVDGAV